MGIRIIAVGQKMPAWVDHAYQEYTKRFPKSHQVELAVIATAQRSSGQTVAKLQQLEAKKILQKIQPGELILALDEHGQQWTTRQWAGQYADWIQYHSRVNLVIGGPDGLASDLLEQANQRIALGLMTLPHGLARVVLIEQLYRAWSVVNGHPYHRE